MSVAHAAEAVSSGTPEWRDPWLHLRGRWDAAADRFSAAAVLYRAVVGTRPEIADQGPDRAGSGGAERSLLTRLVRQATAEEIETLLAERDRARLLVHPGVLARYGLARELTSWLLMLGARPSSWLGTCGASRAGGAAARGIPACEASS